MAYQARLISRGTQPQSISVRDTCKPEQDIIKKHFKNYMMIDEYKKNKYKWVKNNTNESHGNVRLPILIKGRRYHLTAH